MKSVKGTLASVREKTTEVLTEAEPFVNDDDTSAAFITVTLFTKICNDSNDKTEGAIGIQGDSDLIPKSL